MTECNCIQHYTDGLQQGIVGERQRIIEILKEPAPTGQTKTYLVTLSDSQIDRIFIGKESTEPRRKLKLVT